MRRSWKVRQPNTDVLTTEPRRSLSWNWRQLLECD